MRKVFPKYPLICKAIRDESRYRYYSWMKDGITKHKYDHIQKVNRQSMYNTLNLQVKSIPSAASNQIDLQPMNSNNNS